MHIGLIGGIGPAATVAYYQRLVASFKDAELPLELTIVHANAPTLAANSLADKRDAQAEIFAGHLKQLEGAGCDVATITALTGHFCFDETARLSPLPLFSAIDPIDRYCEARGIGTLGLLGSRPVLKSHLFGQLKAVQTVVPQSDLDTLGKAYVGVALSGVCTEADRAMFIAAGAEMVRDQAAEAILLAGTDLGLAFDGQTPGYPVIDALDVHVAALVALASG